MDLLNIYVVSYNRSNYVDNILPVSSILLFDCLLTFALSLSAFYSTKMT